MSPQELGMKSVEELQAMKVRAEVNLSQKNFELENIETAKINTLARLEREKTLVPAQAAIDKIAKQKEIDFVEENLGKINDAIAAKEA